MGQQVLLRVVRQSAEGMVAQGGTDGLRTPADAAALAHPVLVLLLDAAAEREPQQRAEFGAAAGAARGHRDVRTYTYT